MYSEIQARVQAIRERQLSGKGHEPIHIPLHEGVRSLIFTCDWIRGHEKKHGVFTKRLRIFMMSILEKTEKIDAMEFEVDPLVVREYHATGIDRKEHEDLKKRIDRLTGKLTRRSAALGKARKQLKLMGHRKDEASELRKKHAEELEVMNINRQILEKLYEKVCAELIAARAGGPDTPATVSNPPCEAATVGKPAGTAPGDFYAALEAEPLDDGMNR